MKTLARALMLLALMVSFTGFGQTTSDLAQNSSPPEIVENFGDLVGTVGTEALILKDEISIYDGDPVFVTLNDGLEFQININVLDPEHVDTKALLASLKERRQRLMEKPKYNANPYRETDFKLIMQIQDKVPKDIPQRE